MKIRGKQGGLLINVSYMLNFDNIPVTYMIVSRKLIWVLLFISFTVLSCAQESSRVHDGTKMSDEELDKLIAKELANADRAKYGGNANVQVIDNEETVNILKASLLKKIEAENKARSKDRKELTLAEQYLSGNTSVLPQIIRTLTSGNAKEKDQMLRDISLSDYDLRKGRELTDPALAKAILSCMDDPAAEKEAIQVAGFFKVPGYVSKFEARLLSGGSQDTGRLFYWLGSEGSSIKALDHIVAQMKNGKISGDLYWVMSGLSGYAEKNDPVINAKIRALSESYLSKNGMKGEGADFMFRLLCMVPGQSSLVWIKKAVQNKMNLSEALAALVKVEGEKSKALVLQYLNDPETFTSSWEAVEELGRTGKDEELEKRFLSAYEKKSEEHSFTGMMRVLTKIHPADEPLTAVSAVSNKALAEKITRQFEISKLSLRAIADDLYKMKLIAAPITNESLSKAAKEADEYTSNVQAVLGLTNIQYWFDSETGFVPVDYDSLLWRFAGMTNGILKEMVVWMDASTNDDYEHVDYKITVVFNNKAYIMEPDDIGDWYELSVVDELLNRMLEDAGRPERFVFVETGDQTAQYIFGKEEVVRQLKAKYLLD